MNLFGMVRFNNIKEVNMEVSCSFCDGRCFYRYMMGQYSIWQCRRCGTGCVWPMPSVEELQAYYQGFLPNLDVIRLPRIRSACKELLPDLGLQPGRNMSMLDIGGGGGFFCKAFEELGYGKSTYVDLDPQSCSFARDELRLEQVLNCDAMQIQQLIDGKFDFIYCRHVIEHLPEPTTFLSSVVGNLTEHGILVVQFPNGASLEYMAYPKSTLQSRYNSIRISNGFLNLRVFLVMVSGGMLHGIDPPRHLWAITKKGISRWARAAGLVCDTRTYHLGDSAYSPGYNRPENFAGALRDFAGQRLLSRVHGGTHLVAILRKGASG